MRNSIIRELRHFLHHKILSMIVNHEIPPNVKEYSTGKIGRFHTRKYN